MNVFNVVIIGGLHHNTLGVIRSLGEEKLSNFNMHVLLIGKNIEDNNFIKKSKYVSESNISYFDAYEKSIPWLMKLASDGIKRVIICCSDGAAEMIISHKTELENMFYMPTTLISISSLMDKDYQGVLAEASGLRIPRSSTFIIGKPIQWNIFPCIIKPISSLVGGGKADIHIVNDYNDLKNVLRTVKSTRIQIQQFIKKKMEFQLIGCSLSAGRTIIIPGFTNIIRQPENTNTGYLVYSPIKYLDFNLKPVENFIRKIGYSGLFSIEFIRTIDDKDYFLEINMRNDGNAYCVKTAGINLPFIWCYYQLYGHLPKTKLEFEKSVWFIPDFSDMKMGIKAVGLIKWLVEFFTAQSHSIFNTKDMKPFIFEFWRHVRGISAQQFIALMCDKKGLS